jgi:hypothetical protein
MMPQDYKDYKANPDHKAVELLMGCLSGLVGALVILFIHSHMDEVSLPQQSVLTYECGSEPTVEIDSHIRTVEL